MIPSPELCIEVGSDYPPSRGMQDPGDWAWADQELPGGRLFSDASWWHLPAATVTWWERLSSPPGRASCQHWTFISSGKDGMCIIEFKLYSITVRRVLLIPQCYKKGRSIKVRWLICPKSQRWSVEALSFDPDLMDPNVSPLLPCPAPPRGCPHLASLEAAHLAKLCLFPFKSKMPQPLVPDKSIPKRDQPLLRAELLPSEHWMRKPCRALVDLLQARNR